MACGLAWSWRFLKVHRRLTSTKETAQNGEQPVTDTHTHTHGTRDVEEEGAGGWGRMVRARTEEAFC